MLWCAAGGVRGCGEDSGGGERLRRGAAEAARVLSVVPVVRRSGARAVSRCSTALCRARKRRGKRTRACVLQRGKGRPLLQITAAAAATPKRRWSKSHSHAIPLPCTRPAGGLVRLQRHRWQGVTALLRRRPRPLRPLLPLLLPRFMYRVWRLHRSPFESASPMPSPPLFRWGCGDGADREEERPERVGREEQVAVEGVGVGVMSLR